MRHLVLLVVAASVAGGCAAIPDVAYEPQIHNPFPQLSKVAILPFNNLSNEPTLNQDDLALAYYNELQQIPGFEVVPVGVVKMAMVRHNIKGNGLEDYRKLAGVLGVDAVVVGAVTDFSPYYPPRLSLAIDWYAANPCFHPIPPGYGLPWGTAEEEYIPSSLVHEAEFALAREQLKTQTPRRSADADEPDVPVLPASTVSAETELAARAPGDLPDVPVLPAAEPAAAKSDESAQSPTPAKRTLAERGPTEIAAPEGEIDLPKDWPDPRGFVPPAPTAQPPECVPHNGPIISHVRTFNGHDTDFTTAMSNYYHFRDDARFGGWQAYLERSEDFIRFCCYLHISEMLSARGGAGESRVVWRWPIGR